MSIFGFHAGAITFFVVVLVFALAIAFVKWYFLPAHHIRKQLNGAHKKLRDLKAKKEGGAVVTKEELAEVFTDRSFQSAWLSYRDTLHEQKESRGGQEYVAKIRSTVPADNIFSAQSLIDARLHVEFFKHLPGILTGIGIIGTFFGLILGIKKFDPSLLAQARKDPEQLNKLFDGLQWLFNEVQGAFLASFFAILTAMLITFVEKLLINICYRDLEQLCRSLDALYNSGVGEDYLSQLVKHAEESATQTKQLKQSLVTELSALLRDLTNQQIEQSKALEATIAAQLDRQISVAGEHNASVRSEFKSGMESVGSRVDKLAQDYSASMSRVLNELTERQIQHAQIVTAQITAKIQEQIEAGSTHGEKFQQCIKYGLQQIDETVKQTTVGHGESMVNGLNSIVQTFTDSIRKTSGNQMKELAEMMTQAAFSMQNMQAGFDKLVQDMRQTGDYEREELTRKMASMVENIGNSQRELQMQMKEFLSSGLGDVQESVRTILSGMERERDATAEDARNRQKAFSEESKSLVIDMKTNVGVLIEQIAGTVAALRDNVSALNSTSIAAIEKMNDGAEMVSMAAGDFAKAGNKISGVMHQAESLHAQLVHSGNQISAATKSLETVMTQFGQTRDAVAGMFAQMKDMLDRAKDESGINRTLVSNMGAIVKEFDTVRDNVDQCVEGITKILSETLAKFRADMNKHNAEFHKYHADTLNQVAQAYQPLAAAIGGLQDMIAKTGMRR